MLDASNLFNFLRAPLKEARVLVLLFLASALLFFFAKLTSEILQGDLGWFDRAVLLALREPGQPRVPIGPKWLDIAMRDITSLGSPAVLTLITLVVAGFLLLEKKRSAAIYMMLAIVSGSITSTALK
jgi:undecaprenyl-diphosphatase